MAPSFHYQTAQDLLNAILRVRIFVAASGDTVEGMGNIVAVLNVSTTERKNKLSTIKLLLNKINLL